MYQDFNLFCVAGRDLARSRPAARKEIWGGGGGAGFGKFCCYCDGWAWTNYSAILHASQGEEGPQIWSVNALRSNAPFLHVVYRQGGGFDFVFRPCVTRRNVNSTRWVLSKNVPLASNAPKEEEDIVIFSTIIHTSSIYSIPALLLSSFTHSKVSVCVGYIKDVGPEIQEIWPFSSIQFTLVGPEILEVFERCGGFHCFFGLNRIVFERDPPSPPPLNTLFKTVFKSTNILQSLKLRKCVNCKIKSI